MAEGQSQSLARRLSDPLSFWHEYQGTGGSVMPPVSPGGYPEGHDSRASGATSGYRSVSSPTRLAAPPSSRLATAQLTIRLGAVQVMVKSAYVNSGPDVTRNTRVLFAPTDAAVPEMTPLVKERPGGRSPPTKPHV